MSLVDHYIGAVRRQLPRANRDDITAELREILQTQVEEEEAQLGRPLNAEEIGTILQKYGAPREVASRYGARQYLIGPEVFPSYVLSVKVVLWVLAPVAGLLFLATILSAEERLLMRVFQTLWIALTIGLFNLALTTLIFARSSRNLSIHKDRQDWDPEELGESFSGLSDPREPVRRSDAVGSLFGMVLLLAWWLGLNGVLWRWFGWTPLPFEWTAVWTNVSSVAIAVIVAGIAREVMALIRPRWTKVYIGTGIVLDALALGVLLRLLRAGTWVVANPTGPQTFPVRMFNHGILVLLLMMSIAVAVSLVLGALKFLVSQRPGCFDRLAAWISWSRG